MLRALPFQTIGDISRHGFELHVYCSRCFATRRLDLGEHGSAWSYLRNDPVQLPALRHA
jgi:hypothetical protein